MGTDDSQKYMVRDPQGNVYGPADVDMLTQWVMQGRIVPGMHIAPRETGEWAEVSTHPALAHLFPKEATPQEMPPPPDFEQMPPDEPPSPFAEPTPTPYAAPIPTTPVSTYPVTPVNPATTEPWSDASPGPRQNGPAVASLVAGIVTAFFGVVSPCLCICAPVAFLTGLAAIILGGIALAQIKSAPSLYSGRGQAIAGMVLGIGGLLLMILLMVASFALQFRNP